MQDYLACKDDHAKIGSLVELRRFRMVSLTFDNEGIAELFGLEIARLLVDACYRDFAIARYETEKQLINRDRLRP